MLPWLMRAFLSVVSILIPPTCGRLLTRSACRLMGLEAAPSWQPVGGDWHPCDAVKWLHLQGRSQQHSRPNSMLLKCNCQLQGTM